MNPSSPPRGLAPQDVFEGREHALAQPGDARGVPARDEGRAAAQLRVLASPALQTVAGDGLVVEITEDFLGFGQIVGEADGGFFGQQRQQELDGVAQALERDAQLVELVGVQVGRGGGVALAGALAQLGELQASEGSEVGGLDQRVALQTRRRSTKPSPTSRRRRSSPSCASSKLRSRRT